MEEIIQKSIVLDSETISTDLNKYLEEGWKFVCGHPFPQHHNHKFCWLIILEKRGY